MVDTYSSHPFISHDGPDKKGIRAEIKVVTGLGEILNISPSDKGNSAKVEFLVSNTRFKPSGWVPTDSNVYKLVTEAKANNELIEFRIETRRKDSIDRSLPISPLCDTADKARDNIYKSLGAVKRVDDEGWTVSPYALTNMAEDPSTGGGNSANDYTAEQLSALKGDTSAPKSNSGGGFGGGFNNCGGREGAPYMLKNRDGRLNPGSMAVAAPLNIWSFVNEYIRDNDYSNKITKKRKTLTVNTVLSACNEAQLKIYGDLERPDMAAGSHTRARALVFESIKGVYPLTPEVMNDDNALEEWKTETVDMVTTMWNWSIAQTTKIMF